MKTDNYLHNLRHSTAHLLAYAVMELWPDTKRTLGPATDDGFYYDFEFKNPISENDFPKIEKKMRQLVSSWKEFTKEELPAEEAKKRHKNNQYKYELVDEHSEKGKKNVTYYTAGSFGDLCKGGHVKNPSKKIKKDSEVICVKRQINKRTPPIN